MRGRLLSEQQLSRISHGPFPRGLLDKLTSIIPPPWLDKLLPINKVLDRFTIHIKFLTTKTPLYKHYQQGKSTPSFNTDRKNHILVRQGGRKYTARTAVSLHFSGRNGSSCHTDLHMKFSYRTLCYA